LFATDAYLLRDQQSNTSSTINSIGVPGSYSCRHSSATLRASLFSLATGEGGNLYASLNCFTMLLILLFINFLLYKRIYYYSL